MRTARQPRRRAAARTAVAVPAAVNKQKRFPVRKGRVRHVPFSYSDAFSVKFLRCRRTAFGNDAGSCVHRIRAGLIDGLLLIGGKLAQYPCGEVVLRMRCV